MRAEVTGSHCSHISFVPQAVFFFLTESEEGFGLRSLYHSIPSCGSPAGYRRIWQRSLEAACRASRFVAEFVRRVRRSDDRHLEAVFPEEALVDYRPIVLQPSDFIGPGIRSATSSSIPSKPACGFLPSTSARDNELQ